MDLLKICIDKPATLKTIFLQPEWKTSQRMTLFCFASIFTTGAPEHPAKRTIRDIP
jgi:hypothetical protein